MAGGGGGGQYSDQGSGLLYGIIARTILSTMVIE